MIQKCIHSTYNKQDFPQQWKKYIYCNKGDKKGCSTHGTILETKMFAMFFPDGYPADKRHINRYRM